MMVDNNVQDTRFVYRTDESRQLKQKIRDRGYTKIQDGGWIQNNYLKKKLKKSG